MRRRDILILLGVVLITPLGAVAQSRWGKTRHIAFFTPPFASRNESVHSAFVQGMRQLGHAEGQDFIINDVVYDADKPDEAAREMVQHHVDLILAMTHSDTVLAAKRSRLCLSSPVILSLAGLSQACRGRVTMRPGSPR